MYEPAWKRLVENLKERGFESQYLDRLYERLSPLAASVAANNGFRAMEREILEEMASALRRAEDKLNFALLEVELASHAVDLARDPPDLDAALESYETKRAAALRARWEYKVHREALGMIRHDVLDTLFPIPPRRAG